MSELKNAAKKAILQFIDPLDPTSYGWPPACTAIFYQPERPTMEVISEDHKTEE